MLYNIIRKRTIIIILPFLFVLLSCNKLLEVKVPGERIPAGEVFNNEVSATAAVNGIYSRQVPRIADNGYFYLLTGGMTMWGGWSADEIHYAGNNVFFPGVAANRIDPDHNYTFLAMWQPAYQDLYHINACIEGLLKSPSLPQKAKETLLGECYFMRAFYYFYLINLFGDVPLVDHTNYSSNAMMPRTPLAQIHTFMENDLKEAHRLASPEKINGKLSRVNKAIVEAFMARFYLYNKQWAEAEKYAKNTLQNAMFMLEPDHNVIFKRGSRETIWYFANTRVFSTATGEGAAFNVEGFLIAYLTDELVNSFDQARDQRWQKWVRSKNVNATNYPVANKYKIASTDPALIDEDYVVMRLAEQYFIDAEACIQLGKEDEALARLDTIRSRAGLDLLSLRNPVPAGKETLMRLLEEEKRREFFCEFGHRWLDLKRWSGYANPAVTRADEVLKDVKPQWRNSAKLFPIPESERLLNQQLSQNDGYND